MGTVPLLAQACASEAEDLWSDTGFRALNPPAQVACDVLRAKNSQAIIHKPEHISIDPAFLAYLSVGDQCRIYRDPQNFALYTVSEIRNESGTDRLRMGYDGRNRVGTSTTFSGTLDTSVVAQDLTDAQAQAQGEFVERLVDDGSSNRLIALAPHGGFIERYTDDQAERLQSVLSGSGASSWLCKGYKPGGGAFDRWHITSTDISPNSFPLLGEVADRGFEYAVAFHGTTHDVVLIGGAAAPALKLAIRDAIAVVLDGTGIPVIVAGEQDPLAGMSAENIVNWMTTDGFGGVQIEQSYAARSQHGLAIADAVAAVIGTLI